MAETTFTVISWTAGDTVTEAKLDSMVANDRAVDAMAQGIELEERAAPDSPAANKIHIYAKDDNGVTRAFSKDSAGLESPMGISATTNKFRANRSASQTIANVTPTKVQFNTEDYDPGSNYNNSTYRFVAPEAGIYLVTARVALDTMGDGTGTQILIYKNGAEISKQVKQHPSTGTAPVEIVDMVELAATDYIEIFVRHDFGSNRSITADGTQNFFAMHLLSV